MKLPLISSLFKKKKPELTQDHFVAYALNEYFYRLPIITGLKTTFKEARFPYDTEFIVYPQRERRFLFLRDEGLMPIELKYLINVITANMNSGYVMIYYKGYLKLGVYNKKRLKKMVRYNFKHIPHFMTRFDFMYDILNKTSILYKDGVVVDATKDNIRNYLNPANGLVVYLASIPVYKEVVEKAFNKKIRANSLLLTYFLLYGDFRALRNMKLVTSMRTPEILKKIGIA